MIPEKLPTWFASAGCRDRQPSRPAGRQSVRLLAEKDYLPFRADTADKAPNGWPSTRLVLYEGAPGLVSPLASDAQPRHPGEANKAACRLNPPSIPM